MKKRGTLHVEGTPGSTLKLTGNSNSGHLTIEPTAFSPVELVNLNGTIIGNFSTCLGTDDTMIKNCNLLFETEYEAILSMSNLKFEGCGIVKPLGAFYNDGHIWFNGETYKGNLEISTDAAGVENVAAETDEDPNAPMFNVMGQQIEQPYHGQLYIQNGKKKVWFER